MDDPGNGEWGEGGGREEGQEETQRVDEKERYSH